MKRRLILITFISLFILSIFTCGKTQEKNNSISLENSIKTEKKIKNKEMEKEVKNIYKKFYEYKINKNIKELDKILDKDFILTHMTGYKQSKKEWFSQIEDEQMKYYGYEIENIEIKINGDNATLIGKNKTDARIYGSRNKWSLQLVMPMKKVNGNWIILEAIASSY